MSDCLKQNECFEVIDGQQRLITIYLILFYLNDAISILNLPDKNLDIHFQRKIGGFDSICLLNEKIKTVNDESIDLYHLSLAYKTIIEWFDKKHVNKGYFCNALLTHELDDNSRDKAKNIRFIWYESTEENPINVFTRLNIGKICLTNAELIKAIFLNSSNFNEQDSSLKLRQQEIASEWDKIEYSLQNEEFWLFIHDTNYENYTRIDFIFDLVCDQNILGLENSIYESIGSDNYRTFRYFYEYFRNKKNENSIKNCWQNIKNIYLTFCEWYNDVELYHYVGFLIEYKKNISDLLKSWNSSKNKIVFLSHIKSLINKVVVTKKDIDFQYDEDGSNKRESKPILLFHNIQTVINQNVNLRKNNKKRFGVFYKFPFHIYKTEKWDVEHICSSTTNSEDELTIKKEWLINVYLSSDSETQEKIKECLSSDGNESKISEVFEELNNKNEYKSQEWTDSDKNKIWNYALLDSSTNRSYGNIIFSGKRRILIGKDKGKYISIPSLDKKGKIVFSEEKDAISSFIPPCTKNIFMKYYSPSFCSPNYWTKEDAEAYKSDIENCLKQLNEENC